jgi:hypothetical protein
MRREHFGQTVLNGDADAIALRHLDRRAGHRAVETPAIDRASWQKRRLHRLGDQREHFHAVVDREWELREIGCLNRHRRPAWRRQQR